MSIASAKHSNEIIKEHDSLTKKNQIIFHLKISKLIQNQ